MKIELSWSDFKANVASRSMSPQWYLENDVYKILAYDESLLFSCDLENIAPVSADTQDFIDNYKDEWNKKLSKRSGIQEAIPVALYKPEETSFSRATHDFCNKCTWYTMSTRVNGETPTLDTGLIYDLANDYVIDVVNGVVNRQDLLQTYRVVVYDGGTEISGYTVDHKLGKITLDAAPSGSLTVDYSYATTSEWKISPDPGKMLVIEHSEVQFTDDVEVVSPMTFEVWIDNPYFAVVGHPLEGIPRIVAEKVQYNSVRDIINESNLGYTVPSMIEIGKPCVIFPFNYVTVKPLYGYMNAELIIRNLSNEEMPGSYGTATFYLVTRDDIV